MIRTVVVLVNWNNPGDTVRCLASLLESHVVQLRVVLVDNASTDDSVEQIARWAASCTPFLICSAADAITRIPEHRDSPQEEARPLLFIIQNDFNAGFAAGNNLGIRCALASGSDAIWVLNNDTVVDTGCLSAMLNELERDATVGAVGSVAFDMAHPTIVQLWGGSHVDMVLGVAPHIRRPTELRALNMLSGVSALFRASALRQVGLFDERFFLYWEDADLSFRLRSAGWRLAVAADARLWHHESASLGGTASATRDQYYNRSLRLFYAKHSWLPGVPTHLGLTARRVHRLWRRLRSGLTS